MPDFLQTETDTKVHSWNRERDSEELTEFINRRLGLSALVLDGVEADD